MGTGVFGIAYKALSLTKNRELVIKKVYLNEIPDEYLKQLAEEESIKLKALKHPYIIRFEEMFKIN